MRLRSLCVFALCATSVFAQTPAAKKENPAAEPERNAATSLPIKKIVLYKNGVGYFEHTGHVRGNQDLRIDFTTAQLNDVLKSLTLVDLNGGRIAAVNYNSVAPLEEQLKGLQIPLGEDVTSAAFLIALRGTRVEVHGGGGGASGKIFSVETVEKGTDKDNPVQVTQFAIVTDSGEMRLFELGPGVTVRAADPEIQKELERYLGLMRSTRSRDVRRMTIDATGTGERKILVSYISEVPVWKSTYRIVLPKAPAKAFLQGWAIIDNTVGEDWKDVRVSLVSGTPQSFIQNISQPYYVRRPVIELPQSMMLTPQTTHEAGLMSPRALPPPPSPLRGVVAGVPGGVPGGSIGGVMGGVIGGGGNAPPHVPEEEPEDTESAEVSDLLSKEEAAAESAEVGDLFEYNLKEQVTVLKNQSALVPIVQSPIEVEKVTLVMSEADGELQRTPLRALWMKNTSGLTLDGGTFNVLEEDSFAGEGILDLLHPGERRLLSFAADRAMGVSKMDATGANTVTRTSVLKGVIAIHREEQDTATYIFHNADTMARQVILEYPIRDGWKLTGEMKPEEISATRYRFRIAVEPGKTEKFSVSERKPEVRRIYISNLTDSQVSAFAHEGAIPTSLEAELRKVLAKRSEIAGVDQDIKSRQQEMDAIEKDQARLRENMKALKGSPEERALLQRYTKQLDGQEDRLSALQKETGDLKGKRAELQAQLDGMIQGMVADEILSSGPRV
jgi:hypothetical protein